jgi:hypothetical protein
MSMSFKLSRRVFGSAVLALFLASCSTSSLVNVWEDPAYKGGPFKRIIVIGLGADGTMSRTFEDIFAAQLNEQGVQGIAGHTIIPEESHADKAAIGKAAQEAGADGFLLARLVKSEKSAQTAPGYNAALPLIAETTAGYSAKLPVTYNNNFYGYYDAVYTYSAPTTLEYDVVTVESNLWDARTEKLVWSGTTQTFAPGSVSQEAPGFAKLIIKQLASRNLLPVK